MIAIGYAVRDGDGIAFRLVVGPRRGCYSVEAGEVADLLPARAAALRVDASPSASVAPSQASACSSGRSGTAGPRGREDSRRGGRRSWSRAHLAPTTSGTTAPSRSSPGDCRTSWAMCRPGPPGRAHERLPLPGRWRPGRSRGRHAGSPGARS